MNQTKTNQVIVIDCGSRTTPEIKNTLSSLGTASKIISLRSANQFNFKQAAAVIISGGPFLFTDSPEKTEALIQQFEFLREPLPPTLGICLGHQAIALTHGGQVFRGQERRDQDSITVLEKHGLFEGLPAAPLFKEDHCEGIQAGENTRILAESEFYNVEAISINDRPILGVQFHPEVSGDNGKQLFLNFIRWASKQNKDS